MANVNRWSSDEETKIFLVELKNCKGQKLDEGVEWDVEKVALLESVITNLVERSIANLGLHFFA